MIGWNQQQNPWSYGPPKKNPQQGMETYSASILQGGQDYDDIMSRYRGILNRGPDQNQNALQSQYQNMTQGGNYSPQQLQQGPNQPYNPQQIQHVRNSNQSYTPQQLKYNRGPEMGAAFGNLAEYSRTGGISEAEASDIRARGVSPIRSVYANAQQNLNRSRALGGGYSPNYAASSAKMARELSGQLADATTNVEAGIADQRQQGRLAMAPQYAAFADRETAAMGDINRQNEENRFNASRFNQSNRQSEIDNRYRVDAQNEDNRFRAHSQNEDNRFRIESTNEENRQRAEALNRQTRSEGLSGLMGLYGNQRDREMQALQGMSGMYGQAPGMAQLYGNQALQRQQLDQQNQGQQGPYRSGGRSLGGYRPPSQYSGSQWR